MNGVEWLALILVLTGRAHGVDHIVTLKAPTQEQCETQAADYKKQSKQFVTFTCIELPRARR